MSMNSFFVLRGNEKKAVNYGSSATRRFQSGMYGADVGFDAKWHGKIGRGFQRDAEARFIDDEINRFGPEGTVFRLDVGLDDAVAAFPKAIDDAGRLDRTKFAHAINDVFGGRRKFVVIDRVKIIAVRFPILVEDKGHFESWEGVQPRGVGADFRRLRLAIVAI